MIIGDNKVDNSIFESFLCEWFAGLSLFRGTCGTAVPCSIILNSFFSSNSGDGNPTLIASFDPLIRMMLEEVSSQRRGARSLGKNMVGDRFSRLGISAVIKSV